MQFDSWQTSREREIGKEMTVYSCFNTSDYSNLLVFWKKSAMVNTDINNNKKIIVVVMDQNT